MKIKQTEILIPVGTKKFPLIITDSGEIDEDNGGVVHILCKGANLDQGYLKEDIPLLLEDIAELIEMEQLKNKSANINIRIKPSEKLQVEKNAVKNGYKSVSKYMLDLALNN